MSLEPAKMGACLRLSMLEGHPCIWLVLSLWLGFSPDAANGQTGFLSPRTVAKGVIMPLYAEQDPKPVAVVRVERILKEYQRHGFFRIGLLPQVVAEGVTLEVWKPSQMKNVLCELPSRLFAIHNNAVVEIRSVTIRLRDDPTPLLNARSLRFDEAGQWQLREGTLSKPGMEPVQFARATLEPTGLAAGRFCCVTGSSTVELILFCPEPAKSLDLPTREPP